MSTLGRMFRKKLGLNILYHSNSCQQRQRSCNIDRKTERVVDHKSSGVHATLITSIDAAL